MRSLVPALLIGFLDCSGNDVNWVRFNDVGDEIEVQVTAGSELGEPVSEDLHSTTGAVLVGAVTVDPGSGPVGTLHTVIVEIDERFEDVVRRVTVNVDAGARGRDAFELERDSADHGYWALDVESSGVPGEERTDVFTIRLFQEDDGRTSQDEDDDSDS